MSDGSAKTLVLERFREKGRMAGGLRPGFVLRRQAILCVQDKHLEVDLESGISALIEEGSLKSSDSGDFLFLTAAAVERLEEHD